VKYADDALEAAAKLASRHMRDYRLPDSAIDVLDEAGSKARLSAPPRTEGAPVAIIDVGVPQIEEVVARIARIPAKQASSSDRDRLRTLEESLGRVVFGQEEAVRLVARAIKRSRAGLGQPDRPAGAFLFTGDAVEKKCAVLSGGEKARVALAKLLLSPANFLLLDEPTNHLDVESRGVLRDALMDYEGTLCLVSHDRAFVGPLVDTVLEIEPRPEGSRAISLVTSYEDYIDRKRRERERQDKRMEPGERVRRRGDRHPAYEPLVESQSGGHDRPGAPKHKRAEKKRQDVHALAAGAHVQKPKDHDRHALVLPAQDLVARGLLHR
jgi:hypothetical protein